MAKYLDLKVGKKLKIFRFKCGQNQNGQWALFSYTPAEKDQNGNYVYGQEYTIVIGNIDKFNYRLQDGMQVEIESITSVTAQYQEYTNRAGIKVTKTVMNVVVNLKNENQQNIQNPPSQNPNDFNSFDNNNNFGGYDMPDFL